jgi:hypothetical protein
VPTYPAAPMLTSTGIARRQRAWTRWKCTMQETGRKLPTQMADARARCFCGAEIGDRRMDRHVFAVLP